MADEATLRILLEDTGDGAPMAPSRTAIGLQTRAMPGTTGETPKANMAQRSAIHQEETKTNLRDLRAAQQDRLEEIRIAQKREMDELKGMQRKRIDDVIAGQKEELKASNEEEKDQIRLAQRERLEEIKSAHRDELDELRIAQSQELSEIRDFQQSKIEAAKQGQEEERKRIEKLASARQEAASGAQKVAGGLIGSLGGSREAGTISSVAAEPTRGLIELAKGTKEAGREFIKTGSVSAALGIQLTAVSKAAIGLGAALTGVVVASNSAIGELKPFSVALSVAEAEIQSAQIEAKFRRAEFVGPTLAAFATTQNEIVSALKDIALTVVKIFLDMGGQEFFQFISDILNEIAGELKGSLGIIADAVLKIRLLFLDVLFALGAIDESTRKGAEEILREQRRQAERKEETDHRDMVLKTLGFGQEFAIP